MIKKLLLLSACIAFLGNWALAQDEGRFAFQPATKTNKSLALRSDDNKIRIGYCSDKPGRGMDAQLNDEPMEYGGAILLTQEILNKYVGNKLNEIVFFKAEEGSEEILSYFGVFVTKNLDAPSNEFLHLQQVPIGDLKDGEWNRIKLSKEITIEQNTPLYVGIIMDFSRATRPSLMFAAEEGVRQAGANFFRDRGVWHPVDKFPVIDYNLCIFAYAEGANAPMNDVGIRRLEISDFVGQNSSSECSILLRNYARTPLTSLKLSAKLDGEEFQQLTIDTINIKTGMEHRLKIAGVRFPKEGNHNLEFSVAEANGGADTDPMDNSLQKKLFVVKEGGGMQAKKILFEQFVSEKHKNIPIADSLYTVSVNKRRDVIWVKHHVNKDAFSLPYVSELTVFFDNNKFFTPAVMVNREIFPEFPGDKGPAYFINGESFVDQMFGVAASFPSFISIMGTAEWVEASNELKIIVQGKSVSNELPFTKDARLTVLLVEDKILSTTQVAKKEYIQNGVIRAVVTPDIWGEKLDVAQYNYQKEYTVKLNPKWEKKNMRVVAYVSGHNSDPKDRRVHNAEQFAIKGFVANEQALPEVAPKAWYAADAVQVSEGFEVQAVYDLSGRRLVAEHLPSGIYVVQMSNGFTHAVCKILVP